VPVHFLKGHRAEQGFGPVRQFNSPYLALAALNFGLDDSKYPV
jgi:hypothetical protein